MPEFFAFIWDEEEGHNVDHIAEHGVTPQEAEAVIRAQFARRQPSATIPTRWVVRGTTPAGRYLVVVFDFIEEADIIVPITAFEPERLE